MLPIRTKKPCLALSSVKGTAVLVSVALMTSASHDYHTYRSSESLLSPMTSYTVRRSGRITSMWIGQVIWWSCRTMTSSSGKFSTYTARSGRRQISIALRTHITTHTASFKPKALARYQAPPSRCCKASTLDHHRTKLTQLCSCHNSELESRRTTWGSR